MRLSLARLAVLFALAALSACGKPESPETLEPSDKDSAAAENTPRDAGTDPAPAAPTDEAIATDLTPQPAQPQGARITPPPKIESNVVDLTTPSAELHPGAPPH